MFQPNVPTRPSGLTPRSSSAVASRRTRSAHSATVVLTFPAALGRDDLLVAEELLGPVEDVR